MPKDIRRLCTERHYMGASSSGRFVTTMRQPRPQDLPPHETMPHHDPLAQAAWKTRYLREQDVIWWVQECQDAKDEIAGIEAWIERVEHALETPEASDEGAERRRKLEMARPRLHDRHAQAVNRRREASRQLRLLGISPKEQAAILEEIVRRSQLLEAQARK